MKRNPPQRRSRQNQGTEQLIGLATQLGLSASRIEDSFWEARLCTLIDRLFAEGTEDALTAALDQLENSDARAFDALANMVESRAETRTIERAGEPPVDALLITAPVLVWSRLPIPSGTIPAPQLDALRVQLQAHVLAAGTGLSLANVLYSPDQLPRNYSDTARLTDRLGKLAINQSNFKQDPAQLPETIGFLSDLRYLVGVVTAPTGAPLFRWQEADGNRDATFEQWTRQGGETLRTLLPACAMEFLPVQAYHSALIEADRASRPWSIRSGIAFLQTVMNLKASDLRAVIAPFHDQQLEEYRIGFTQLGSADVIHGVVWPLIGNEDENLDAPNQIEQILKQAGVSQIVILDHRFPLEYCDDCGSPLFPDPHGEPVHAGLPEGHDTAPPRHLH